MGLIHGIAEGCMVTFIARDLATYTKTGADRHANDLMWVNAQLALSKINQAKPADARTYQTELVRLARNAHGDEVSKLVTYLTRTSILFGHQPERAKVEDGLRLALVVSEANSHTATTLAPGLMIDLAFALAKDNKQREAAPYLTRAIRALERNENANARELVATLYLYSHILHDLGRPADSKTYWDRAQALSKKASKRKR